MDKTRKELLLKVHDIENQLSANINNINSAISNLSQRVDQIETNVNKVLSDEVSELQKRCDVLERK